MGKINFPKEERCASMRVAIVVCVFPPYHGGMGNMALSYALGLSRIGHRVEVFCPRYREVEREPDMPFRTHRLKPWGRLRNSAFLPQLANRLVGFDIVNLHYPFYGGAEIVYGLKKIRGRRFRLIINYHMDNYGMGVAGLSFKLYRGCLMPLILRSGDRIIVTSYDYVANSAAARLFSESRERFIEIPPAVDIERFKPSQKDKRLLEHYGIKAGEKVVLFVGGLDQAHSFKGIDFLLGSWQGLGEPRTRLLIVGQGELKERYMRQAERLGISGTVLFADPVEDRQLPEYYGLADLLVLPSVNSAEAFGIVLIEAMASGVPVVAANLPGVRTAVEDGRNGFLFKVMDSRDLLRKIRLVLSDGRLRESLGRAGRETVEDKYSQDKVWRRLEKSFEEVLP